MFELNLWLDGLAVIAVFAAVGWLLSLPLRNVSIVDSMWSLMFLNVFFPGPPRAA